jgi:propanediol utilization protein
MTDNIGKDDIRKIVEQVLAAKGYIPAGPAPAAKTGRDPAKPAPALRSAAPAVQDRGRIAPPFVPAEASARHVHLTEEAFGVLFGPGAALAEKRALSQPGEFLSEQRVRISGPKGEIGNIAVLGPLRKAVQAELSLTDARILGIEAPLRLSGDLSGAAEIGMTGPAGTLRVKAAIIAKRHIHLRPEDAELLRLKNGDTARLRVRGKRPVIFEDVSVRVSENFMPALHLDFDEANACMLSCGDQAEILDRPPVNCAPPDGQAAGRGGAALITEQDAKRLVLNCGGGPLKLPKKSIITPSAKDVFLHSRCKIELA